MQDCSPARNPLGPVCYLLTFRLFTSLARTAKFLSSRNLRATRTARFLSSRNLRAKLARLLNISEINETWE